MEFLRAIGPVFNFLLLAGALFFLTRKRIRKLFRDRKERIAEALGRAADAQDQARHTAEDIAEAQQAADAQAQCQLGEFVEGLDRWHAGGGDVFAGRADLAHLVQRKHAEDQHQAADQGETGERTGGDIHIAEGHGRVPRRAASMRAETAIA